MKKFMFLFVLTGMVLTAVVLFTTKGRNTEANTETPLISCLKEPFADIPVSTVTAFDQSEDWLRNFKIEVVNSSKKPVYFVSYVLVLPALKAKYGPVAIAFSYGRRELMDVMLAAKPTDVPIPPGGKTELKVSQEEYEAVRDFARECQAPLASINNSRLLIQQVNFGDSTGWQAGYFLAKDGTQSDVSRQSRVLKAGFKPMQDCGPDPLCGLWKFVGWSACCGVWRPVYEDVGTHCYHINVVTTICSQTGQQCSNFSLSNCS